MGWTRTCTREENRDRPHDERRLAPRLRRRVRCPCAGLRLLHPGHVVRAVLRVHPAKAAPEAGDGAALGELSRYSRPWLYISLLVFILTGVYLLLIDSNYLGIGNFSNPWAVLMLVKHIVVVAMIALGFWFKVVKRVGQDLRSVPGDAQRRARFRRYSDIMTLCGVLVLILTAFAQIEQCVPLRFIASAAACTSGIGWGILCASITARRRGSRSGVRYLHTTCEAFSCKTRR